MKVRYQFDVLHCPAASPPKLFIHPNQPKMRFQVQILLVAAVCASFIHGACSAPTSDALLEPSDDSVRTADDNGENDENPFVIAALKLAAKVLVKKVGCAIALKHARSCGARQLFDVPMDRFPEVDDEGLDEGVADILKAFGCKAARFISNFC